MLQKPGSILTAGLFPEVLDALLDLLGSLTPPEWESATVAAGWTVKEVALHLLGDIELPQKMRLD